MRYRLRTLLMLTTICCVYAAWVGFVWNKAAYHQREANRIAAELALSAEWETKEMKTLISNIASHSHGRVDGLRFQVEVPFDPYLAKHCQAANHQILANTYNQATVRPWKIFEASFSP